MSTPAKFTHLHVHSHYSLLDGLPKIDEMVIRAKELGMDALALTDHGVLYGAIEFYKKATAAGIKPIIGIETYVAPNGMGLKRPGIDDARYHLILLAKDDQGYRNLLMLASKAHLEGYYYKPRIDKNLLGQYARGLIGLSACLSGEIPRLAMAGRSADAERSLAEYEEIFGKGNFYLELQHHQNIPEQQKLNSLLIDLARKFHTPLVATADLHYLRPEDAEAQDVLMAISTNAKTLDEERLSMRNDNFSMRSPEEMAALFADIPEAIENTQKIADECSLAIELGKTQLPHYEIPAGKSAEEYLRELCNAGASRRYATVTPEIRQRLDYELDAIGKTGFASYFLVVQDFVNWAKNRGIVVGPGRGSAAGSLVAYALNITNVDPLRYGLLFERFINPERISPPDIDLDFTDLRRDEVLEYVAHKYGREHVAQIVTFGTMKARLVVRDVARVLGFPYQLGDTIAKTIPFGWDLKQSLKENEELKQLYATNPDAKRVIDTARKLEGVVRHASTHACGVVITRDPLTNVVPLQHATRQGSKNGNGENSKALVTQYEMHAIEDLGLLKMDFLGLKNLTIIESTLKLIEKNHGVKIDIDGIALDDAKAFALLQRAETTGVFQLESGGMRRYLLELKPTELEDIIAMVSLYRPGPMELIPSYINRKHGKEEITYLHPKLAPILQNTYGIGVYQEQMMQIARDLAGFTLPQADTLRKAIGKKIKSLLDEQREKLVTGMKANGIEARTAEAIWELFPPFARYGFNRCLTGDTRVMDPASGTLVTLKALYEKEKNLSTVLSLERNLKIKNRTVSDVISNGRKPVWKVTTRSGRSIKATANHPFLTPHDWQKLEDIPVGGKIAVPRMLPEPQKPLKIKAHKLAVLGYLLAEGNLCHPHGFYFYSKSNEEVSDYLRFLDVFENTKGKVDNHKSTVSVYAGRINLKKPSEAVSWIESLGLKYKKATEKFLPAFVFRLSNADLAFLIAKMFQGDGCVNNKRDPQIFYATSSDAIARDLQHLLLRLGILSSIHRKCFKYRGAIKIGYTVTISRHDNIRKFLETCRAYFIGEKRAVAKEILEQHPIINGTLPAWSARGSYDTIPVALVHDHIRAAVAAHHQSFAVFARDIGISERLFLKDKRKIGYLRETVGIIGNNLRDNHLLTVANADIYWDQIKSIEPAGIEDTYDLTIDETHNFVANDMIVHNSHAACYATVAYQTAYLKAHYPAEFMAALLTGDQGDIERTAFLVDECRKMKIRVLAPNVNESDERFTVVDATTLRFGLAAIKNVGEHIVEAIIAERAAKGKFASISDFIGRIHHKDLNKKSLESLIRAGALDELGERGLLLGNIDALLEHARQLNRAQSSGQSSLFASAPQAEINVVRLTAAAPVSKRETLAWEKELLGLYVSSHPLEDFRERFSRRAVPIARLAQAAMNGRATIGAIITATKKIITKNGKPMLFVELEDLSGKVEAIVFPDFLERHPTIWQQDKILLVSGKLSSRDGTVKLLCEAAEEVA
ncbi:MAG: DNA polymerase III subunit alpha [bacterium]|nr:DNA polymerase III subunit alpha [bacterium]MDZ4296334.1 DNA polymerase III subunit alpha [Patescibacteria group bacterium]